MGQWVDKALFHKITPSCCASCKIYYSSFQTQARSSFQPFHLALEKHPKTKPLCTPIAHPMQVSRFTAKHNLWVNSDKHMTDTVGVQSIGHFWYCKGKLPNSRLPNSQSFRIPSPFLCLLKWWYHPIWKIVEKQNAFNTSMLPYFSTFQGARKNGFFRWYWCPPCRLCHWTTSFSLAVSDLMPLIKQSLFFREFQR